MSRRTRDAVLRLLLATATAAPATAQPWGGEGCAPAADLRSLVDAALAASPSGPFFGDGRGSGAPGYSAAVVSDECGVFAYAAGDRWLAPRRPMQAATRHHLGSLTKPVTAALTVMLADEGAFGPDGIDTPIAGFFTAAERRLLRKGPNPGEPLCPAQIQVVSRFEGGPVSVRAGCPRLSRIALRHLLNGNHGMWDFVNEVDRDANGVIDLQDYQFPDLLDRLGVPRRELPDGVEDAFSLLTVTGLLRARGTRIGGTRIRDFEASFGNTGHQLVGLILERVTGESYDRLVRDRVARPLGIGRMVLAVERPTRRRTAGEYGVTSGASLVSFPRGQQVPDDLFGLYALVDLNGHLALDVYDIEPFVITNGGGGAGALTAAPRDYARFFHALVRGGLLSAGAQQLLEDGFLAVDGTVFSHGFGLFRVPSAGLGTLITKGGATIGSNCFAAHSLGSEGGSGITAVVCRNSADLFLPNPGAGAPNSSISVGDVVEDLLVATGGL